MKYQRARADRIERASRRLGEFAGFTLRLGNAPEGGLIAEVKSGGPRSRNKRCAMMRSPV
jgi:hypothetical protein